MLVFSYHERVQIVKIECGVFGRGGSCNNRFVLKSNVTTTSEAAIFGKNSLAKTDLHAKKNAASQLLRKPPSWTPPIRNSQTQSGSLEVNQELGRGCQLLTRTCPCRNCRGLSCRGPVATRNVLSRFEGFPTFFVHPFSCFFCFSAPCPPHPSPGKLLLQNSFWHLKSTLSCREKENLQGLGFGDGFGRGRPTGKKGKSFFSWRAKKRWGSVAVKKSCFVRNRQKSGFF